MARFVPRPTGVIKFEVHFLVLWLGLRRNRAHAARSKQTLGRLQRIHTKSREAVIGASCSECLLGARSAGCCAVRECQLSCDAPLIVKIFSSPSYVRYRNPSLRKGSRAIRRKISRILRKTEFSKVSAYFDRCCRVYECRQCFDFQCRTASQIDIVAFMLFQQKSHLFQNHAAIAAAKPPNRSQNVTPSFPQS